MHIILGILGTIVTILVLFNRLSDSGIDTANAEEKNKFISKIDRVFSYTPTA